MKQNYSNKLRPPNKSSAGNTKSKSNADIEGQSIIKDKAGNVLPTDYCQVNSKTLPIHKVSLDWMSFTVPIPDKFHKLLFARLDRYKKRIQNDETGFHKVNDQYKTNIYGKAGQYKNYLVIPVKSKNTTTYVILGYRPKGTQNALWVRFNPAHFSSFGYRRLKKELLKILKTVVLQYFSLAVPTRLDIAVDILGITPNQLFADLRKTRDSSLHFSSGNVKTITMGTNRSPTQVCIYQKNFVDPNDKSKKITGTRVEIRLRRLNRQSSQLKPNSRDFYYVFEKIVLK